MTAQGPTPAQAELLSAIEDRRLVVCVGSGGVGKTTTAAAIAIQAAIQGRKAIVVTIDPARRLANSLGLEALGNDERAIPLEKFTACGVEPKGTLHAMMLDTRKTFDEVIWRVSPDEETRSRVLRNRVYRHISDTLSASHDYMATEKLYDLHTSGRYDLVVLDTPPMKNAIDFLEASGRLSRFLDEKIVGWFLRPHQEGRKRGLQLLSGTGSLVYRLLGSVFGNQFLDEIADFFLAFRELLAGFRERADEVSRLLRNKQLTRFVVVCTPQSTSMEEARYFHAQLMQRSMPGGLFIVNQVGRYPGATFADEAGGRFMSDSDREWLADKLANQQEVGIPGFMQRLEAHFGRTVARSVDDQRAIDNLRSFAGRQAKVCTIPRLLNDVYDFRGLLDIDGHLFGLESPDSGTVDSPGPSTEPSD
jgi:anion-transporting  ArsA/GET3 family ATPase